MSTRSNLITGIAIGSGIGSGLMFLLDPLQGHRRRARARDHAARWSKTTGRAIQRTGQVIEAGYRRAASESRGAIEGLRKMTTGGEQVDDRTLEARLRSCVGRHSSHAEAINVSVLDGCATLSGAIVADEVREVLKCVSATQGVMAVNNMLEVKADARDLPQQQGAEHRRNGMTWWRTSPAVRVATSAAAAALLAMVAGRRMMG